MNKMVSTVIEIYQDDKVNPANSHFYFEHLSRVN